MKIRISSHRMSVIELLLISFLGAAYLLPAMKLSEILLLGILFLYAGFIALADRQLQRPIITMMILIVILACWYAILTDAASIETDASDKVFKRFFSKLYQYSSLYLPAAIFVRVYRAAALKQKKALLVILIALVAFVVFTTWRFLIQNPKAARQWEMFSEYADNNIANYFFLCAFPAVISAIVVSIAKSAPIKKILLLFVLVIGLEFILRAQYTLPFLISLIVSGVYVIKSLRSVRTKFLLGSVMVLFALFLPMILRAFIRFLGSSSVAIRLSEIYDFLTGQGAGGYNLSSRLTLYKNTLIAFFESPIWGVRSLGFDGHATFLTVLSDTGLVGGIPFYFLLYTVYKTVSVAFNAKNNEMKTVVLTFVLTGLTNPVHGSLPIGFLTWFFAPLVILIVCREENLHETTL